tara:strand:+ start:646 stop:810 length:165 start_codon:yes stop_codon:yes gene_type:complete
LTWNNFEPRTDVDRRYFEISVLDIDQIKRIAKKNPTDFPSVEEWMAGWKQQQAE